MLSVTDYEGDEKSYGYTKDDDGEVWYWSVPHDGDVGDLEFTERGTHTDHPIRKMGDVPEHVREHAETHADAAWERAKDPRY